MEEKTKIEKIMKALDILRVYQTEGEKKWPFWSPYDILGFCVDYEKISQDDLKLLEELDVFYDSDYDCLITFV